MTRIFLFTSLILLSFSAFSAGKNDKEAVANCFQQYTEAILNDRGEEAVRYVSSSTTKYFADILHKVKTYDSSQLEQLALLDKMMVLIAKARAGKEEILAMQTGNDFILYAINNGMVGKESVSSASIGEITIKDNFAKGEYILNGKRSSFYMHFYYEEDSWRFDLTHNIKMGRPAMRQMVENSGMTETEFILYIIESLTGKKPTPDIWQPLQ